MQSNHKWINATNAYCFDLFGEVTITHYKAAWLADYEYLFRRNHCFFVVVVVLTFQTRISVTDPSLFNNYRIHSNMIRSITGRRPRRVGLYATLLSWVAALMMRLLEGKLSRLSVSLFIKTEGGEANSVRGTDGLSIPLQRNLIYNWEPRLYILIAPFKMSPSHARNTPVCHYFPSFSLQVRVWWRTSTPSYSEALATEAAL